MCEQGLMLMGEFFDHVSATYDEVHSSHIDRAEEYYAALADQVTATSSPVAVLDIGCGSGLELEGIFRKLPDARVHCVDLSRKLMDKLLHRYAHKEITPHLESYLTYSYPLGQFKYIVASATLHHLLDDEKRELYPKLRHALTADGCLIVGDYFVSSETADECLERYRALLSKGVDLTRGRYHFDIPTTVDNERKILVEAGFLSVDIVWQSSNFSVLTARPAPN
ncbi:MAG: class I SAM-dependent methyltransferase [Limnochordia bacterium]